MGDWFLGVELNGEWEMCRFKSQAEAIRSFQALRRDYQNELLRAILLPSAAIGALISLAPGNQASQLIQ